jgi:glycosyltransferase involved in cell wall biosynthesis
MSFIYRFADCIVVLSPGFKRLLEERGVSCDKINVIYNWCEEPELSAADHGLPSKLGLEAPFVVLFAGTMGTAQALDSVLDAAAICATENPSIVFFFVGGGVDRSRLVKRARDMELPNVRFLPSQPVENMPPLLARADALIVHLRNDRLFETTIPSKIQSYMRAGRPIVAGVTGDAARLVQDAGAGIPCTPENPRSIADAVIHLASLSHNERELMGRSGARYYGTNLSLSVGVKQFMRLFETSSKPRRDNKRGA